MADHNAPRVALSLQRGGVGKTTTPVSLASALSGDPTIIDVDSAFDSTVRRVDAEECLGLVTDLTALTPDPANDPVIGGMAQAREQFTARAREAVEACRALSEDELERLGPGQFLFDWVARLGEALSEPRDSSGSLLAADVAARMDAIDEAAREVSDRTTALAQEFPGGSPAARRLRAALRAVTQSAPGSAEGPNSPAGREPACRPPSVGVTLAKATGSSWPTATSTTPGWRQLRRDAGDDSGGHACCVRGHGLLLAVTKADQAVNSAMAPASVSGPRAVQVPHRWRAGRCTPRLPSWRVVR
jgi:hypothetical protein